jgi:secreted trypsin-like serine protease
MQHRRLLVPVALLLSMAACGDSATLGVDDPGRTESAIIGGSKAVDADYPAVGSLLFKATDPYYGSEIAGMLCTGTLIAPDVVLLASHCIDPEPIFGAGVTPTWFFSFALDVTDFGYSTMTLPAKTYAVAKALKNPQYDASDFDTFTGGLGEFHDIALLFLQTAVTDRTPAVVLGPNDTAGVVVDAPVKIIGYGVRASDYDPQSTNPDDAGIKYLATSMINETGAAEMQIGDAAPTPQKCHGDSGGPTFLTFSDKALPAERLIGVTSHAYDETDCYKGGVDTRVDLWRTWIDTEMKKACTDAVRTSCQGGGALAVPAVPPPVNNNTSTDYINSKNQKDDGCAASGAPTLLSALTVALLLGLSRRRG